MKIPRKIKSLIILLLIASVLFGAATVLKNIFLSQVKRKIQARFGFEKISLSPFPPALVIKDVRSTSRTPFFSAEKITLKVSFHTLLSRERRLNLIVEKPVVRFSSTEAGKDLLGRAKLSLALPVVIEKALVREGEVYYWSESLQVQFKGIDALLILRGERFSVQLEAGENSLSYYSPEPQVTGRLSLVLDGQGEKINIRKLKVVDRRGILTAEGSASSLPDLEFELETYFNLRVPLIVDLFKLPFSWEGRAEGRGNLRKSQRELLFSAGFSSDDLILNRFPMGRVDGKLNLKPESGGMVELTVQKRKLAREFIRLRFQGTGIEGLAQSFYLDPLIADLNIPWPVASPVWGTFEISSGRLKAAAEFRDELAEPPAPRFPFQGLVRLDWDGGERFSLSSEKLASSFAEVEFEANIRALKDVDVSIRGEVTDVRQARRFTSLVLQKEYPFPEIRGRGKADIRIFGGFLHPQVKAKFSLFPAGFDRFDVAACAGEAEVIQDKFFGNFHFKDALLEGRISLSADKAEVRGNLMLERGSLAKIFNSLEIPASLRGEASGNFEFYQTEEGAFFGGDFLSPQASLSGQSISLAKGKLKWQKDFFSLSDFQCLFHGGKVEGTVVLRPLSKEFDLDLRANDISLSPLHPLAQGNLILDLKGQGVFGRDAAAGHFEIKDLILRPFQKTQASGDLKLSFTEEKVDLKIDGNFSPGENEFHLTLGIPLAGQNLGGEVRGFFSNLNLLLPWQGAEGRLNYLGEIRGTKFLPQLKGAIDFSGAVLPFPRFAHALRDFKGLVFVDNGNFSLRSFTGQLGGGEVQGSGSLKVAGNGVEKIDLRAEGENLLLSPWERTRGLAQGKLRLIKEDGRFALDGDIFVRHLSWRRELNEKFVFYSSPYLERREPDFFDGLNLNIRVRADDNAWMENSLGRVRGKFDLTITGNVKLPIVLGDIEALAGEVFFQDREFKILRGRVSFFNPLTIEPYLSFRAETYVKDYRVTFSLEGLMDKLSPEFSSSPPLPPEDVLALLALGESFKRTYSYDRSTQLSTASLLSFQLSEEAKKRADTLFSIDRFRIDPFVMGSSAEMTARLTLGKKISRNFFLLYSTNLTTQREEITRIEWELTSDLSIVGTRDEKGRVSIDVKIHKRF